MSVKEKICFWKSQVVLVLWSSSALNFAKPHLVTSLAKKLTAILILREKIIFSLSLHLKCFLFETSQRRKLILTGIFERIPSGTFLPNCEKISCYKALIAQNFAVLLCLKFYIINLNPLILVIAHLTLSHNLGSTLTLKTSQMQKTDGKFNSMEPAEKQNLKPIQSSRTSLATSKILIHSLFPKCLFLEKHVFFSILKFSNCWTAFEDESLFKMLLGKNKSENSIFFKKVFSENIFTL